jgi:RNA polymerase sigma factor (sigma-70 family)
MQPTPDHIDYAGKLAAIFIRRFKLPPSFHEDAHAAALLGLCAAARTFDPAHGVPFKTYCFPAVHGAVCAAVRHQVRHLVAGEELSDEASYDPLDDEIMARDVRRLVATLPDAERKVIRLLFFEDASVKQVMALFETSKVQVWRIRSRAIERLRKRWAWAPVRRAA